MKKRLKLTAFVVSVLFLSVSKGFSLDKGQIEIGGVKRTFYYSVPKAAVSSETAKLPVLMALHGGGGTGKRFSDLDNGRFIELSKKNGFIIVFPKGKSRKWNDGRAVEFSESDDVGFLSALIDHFVENFRADKERVFFAGISNGGFMSFTLAFEIPEKIKGIAIISSSLQKKMVEQYKKTKPLPVLVINGDKDTLIPLQGGKPGKRMLIKRKLGEIISYADMKAFWLENNGCDAEKVSQKTLDSDPEDETRVFAEEFNDCAGAKAAFYLIENGGHTWAGGKQYLPEFMIGKTSRDINASEVIADFFGLVMVKSKE